MKILITGSAGFIGYHLAKSLMSESNFIIGLDNLNSYYDKKLKLDRLKELATHSKKEGCSWEFIKADLTDEKLIDSFFQKQKPEIVINLAAQAGVRYSLENPREYISSNIVGFCNILECCKKYPVNHLIYASSSSVYGGSKILPFNENSNNDHPVSLYAATKKSNELMAHTYSHLYKIPATGLRFFTVYGPWGRPDMAPMIFTKSILSGEPINIFNRGEMSRDFTYIEDIVNCIKRLINHPPQGNKFFDFKNPDSSSSWCPHQIFNLGNNKVVSLMDFIKILESEIGKKAIKNFDEMQKGDVKDTFAETTKIYNYIGYKPSTTIQEGIKKFINWYKKYYLK